MATKPVVMTSASLILCGGSSPWPIAFKMSVHRQYRGRIFSSMGLLIFQGGGGGRPSPGRKSPMDVKRSQLGLVIELIDGDDAIAILIGLAIEAFQHVVGK